MSVSLRWRPKPEKYKYKGGLRFFANAGRVALIFEQIE